MLLEMPATSGDRLSLALTSRSGLSNNFNRREPVVLVVAPASNERLWPPVLVVPDADQARVD
jgi:hypothetical protein